MEEYGKTEITYSANGVMFKDLPSESVCWMSHFDRIAEAAPGFEVVAHTADCPIAATQNVEKKLYAVQFHPEGDFTPRIGTQMIYNFVRGRMWMCRHMEDGFIRQKHNRRNQRAGR